MHFTYTFKTDNLRKLESQMKGTVPSRTRGPSRPKCSLIPDPTRPKPHSQSINTSPLPSFQTFTL
ncbi:hypothetical protein HanRHA438_Chr16g0761541 [Helianthus annuus]|nr:hypothetical protein HanRHA438_Chr16g0761541 [Helianthus annuus]